MFISNTMLAQNILNFCLRCYNLVMMYCNLIKIYAQSYNKKIKFDHFKTMLRKQRSWFLAETQPKRDSESEGKF